MVSSLNSVYHTIPAIARIWIEHRNVPAPDTATGNSSQTSYLCIVRHRLARLVFTAIGGFCSVEACGDVLAVAS